MEQNKFCIRKSMDGESWSNCEEIASSVNEKFYSGHMKLIDKDTILWVGAEMNKFDSYGSGIGYLLSGFYNVTHTLPNIEKAISPRIEIKDNYLQLSVIAKGDQSMDVSFYLDNGTFLGMDHMVKNDEKTQVFIRYASVKTKSYTISSRLFFSIYQCKN